MYPTEKSPDDSKGSIASIFWVTELTEKELFDFPYLFNEGLLVEKVTQYMYHLGVLRTVTTGISLLYNALLNLFTCICS
jgi:hypothetical protein